MVGIMVLPLFATVPTEVSGHFQKLRSFPRDHAELLLLRGEPRVIDARRNTDRSNRTVGALDPARYARAVGSKE